MSWGTSFNAEIYLIRESYADKSLVEAAITESEKNIAEAKTRITMAIAGNARDFFDTENLMYNIQEFIDSEEEIIQEESVKIFKLNLLYDYMVDGGTPVVG